MNYLDIDDEKKIHKSTVFRYFYFRQKSIATFISFCFEVKLPELFFNIYVYDLNLSADTNPNKLHANRIRVLQSYNVFIMVRILHFNGIRA